MNGSAQRVSLSRRANLILTSLLLLVASCTDGHTPAEPPAEADAVRLTLLPQYAVNAGSAVSLPITDLRFTVMNVAGTETLHVFNRAAPTGGTQWEIELEISAPPGFGPIIVLMELLNITNGATTVVMSGVTAPITLSLSETQRTAAIRMVDGPPANLAVTGITVSPASTTVVEGESVTLTAAVQGTAQAQVFWSTLDPDIATVSSTGTVTLLRDGAARIVANAGVHADTAIVSARQRPASILIAPGSAEFVSIAQELTFTADVLDPRGTAIDGMALSWSIDDQAIAEAVGGGTFRSRANGATQVRVTADGTGLTAAAPVTVAQQPASVTVEPGSFVFGAIGLTTVLAARVLDANGHPVHDVSIAWRSSAADVVLVGADGAATAVSAGDATVTAETPRGISGSAVMAVRQAVAALQLTPTTLSFDALGLSSTLTVTAHDANGHLISRPDGLLWSSADAGVVTVDANGAVTSVGNGATLVTVGGGAATVSADVSVAQVVAGLTIDPTRLEMSGLGAAAQLTATALDANDRVIENASVAWSSSDPAIVAVDAAGVITATGYGQVTITAASVTRTAVATITVLRPVISIEPRGFVFAAIGESGTVAATVRDAHGNVVPDAPVTWTSSDPAVATVSGTTVTATGAGSALITAAHAGVEDAITVRVEQAPASIIVAPETIAIAVGETVLVTARVLDANSFDIAGVTFAFASGDATIASIAADGLVTGIAAGATSVTVSALGLSGEIPVTITSAGGLPDIQIVAALLDPPGDLRIGFPSLVTVSLISLNAPAPATAAVLNVYAAGSNALLHSEALPQPALPANQAIAVQVPILPTADWPSDVFTVLHVDAPNTIPESDEENNAFRFPAVGSLHVLSADEFPSITITPAPVLIAASGQSAALTATVLGIDGLPVPDPALIWTSLNTNVVTVDANGMATAVGDGLAHIEVTGHDMHAVVLVQVGAPMADATITWIGTIGARDWNDPGNWSGHRVPAANDVVFIPDCDAYGLWNFCSYPRLTGDVSISGVSTGSNNADEFADAHVAVPSRIVQPDGDVFDWLADRPTRERPTRPAMSLVGSRPFAVAESSEVFEWYHVNLSGYTLTISDRIRDFAALGSASGGRVRFTGSAEHPAVFVEADTDIIGSFTGQLDVVGTLNVQGSAELNGWVEGPLNVSGSLLVLNGFFYSSGDVTIAGSLTVSSSVMTGESSLIMTNPAARVDVVDGSWLFVDGDMTVNGGTATFADASGMSAYSDLIVDGASSRVVVGDHSSVYVGEAVFDAGTCSWVVVGDFITRNGGTLSMNAVDPGMTINRRAVFEGGSTHGLLTSGTLVFRGSLSVGGPDPLAFAPGGSHRTEYMAQHGSGHAVTFAQPGSGTAGSHFNHFFVGSSLTLTFNSALYVDGEFDKRGTAVVIGSDVTVGGDIWLYNPESWQFSTTTMHGPSMHVQLGGPLVTDLTLNSTLSLPTLFELDGNLTVTGENVHVTTAANASVSGNATVELGARLILNSVSLDVHGDFTTMSGGTLAMNAAGSQLTVRGNAAFQGGATTGLLDTGTLILLHGQLNVGAPAAYQAGGDNVLLLWGESTQQISMQDAGAGPAQNRLGSLQILNTAGALLTTDLHLTGNLDTEDITATSVSSTCEGGCLIDAGNAVSFGLTIDNTRLHLREASGPIALGDITFAGANAQLSLRRDSGADIAFNNFDFSPVLNVSDTAHRVLVLDGPFQTSITNMTPASLLPGRVLRLNGATFAQLEMPPSIRR